MINYSLKANLSRIKTLIAKDCLDLCDKCVEKIPHCENLDLTNCYNIIGSFLDKKPIWTFLKLSGCHFFDQQNFRKLMKCQTLNLCQIIIFSVLGSLYFKTDISIHQTLLQICDNIILDFHV